MSNFSPERRVAMIKLAEQMRNTDDTNTMPMKDIHTNQYGDSLTGLDRVVSMMDKSGKFDWILKIADFLSNNKGSSNYKVNKPLAGTVADRLRLMKRS